MYDLKHSQSPDWVHKVAIWFFILHSIVFIQISGFIDHKLFGFPPFWILLWDPNQYKNWTEVFVILSHLLFRQAFIWRIFSVRRKKSDTTNNNIIISTCVWRLHIFVSVGRFCISVSVKRPRFGGNNVQLKGPQCQTSLHFIGIFPVFRPVGAGGAVIFWFNLADFKI